MEIPTWAIVQRLRERALLAETDAQPARLAYWTQVLRVTTIGGVRAPQPASRQPARLALLAALALDGLAAFLRRQCRPRGRWPWSRSVRRSAATPAGRTDIR